MLLPILVLVSASLASAQEPQVEIVDVWGTVTLQVGQDQEFTCVASETDGPGTFEWFIGDTVIPNSNSVKELGEGKYAQTLSFATKIEYHKKKLKCSFTSSSLTSSSDSLTVTVVMIDLPGSPFFAGDYKSDRPGEIVLRFKLFPPPRQEDVVWGAGELRFLPGEKDTLGRYEAKELNDLGDNSYEAIFLIGVIDKEETERKHFLEIKSENLGSHRVDIRLALHKEAAPTTPVPMKPSPTPVIEITTQEPGKTKLGVGLFIIIAIVVLIILVCVGYCIYQRSCKKSKEPRAKTGYEQAPTKDQAV